MKVHQLEEIHKQKEGTWIVGYNTNCVAFVNGNKEAVYYNMIGLPVTL